MKLFIIIFLLITLPVSLTLTTFSAATSISEYTKAIEDGPEDMKYKFYLLRGKAFKDSGNINSALKDFSTSIMLKPSIEAYQYRGEIYLEQGRNISAIKDFTSAIEIRPSIYLYKLRGKAYLNSENYVMALSDAALIIESDPNVSESYNLMIEVCDKLEDVELGREKAREALSIDKTNKIANEFISKYPLKIKL
jgi:tetratricopeptide (TPR) repeat protein